MIPAQAVEAACEQLNEAGVYVSPKYMRAALEAAAPHMLADVNADALRAAWDRGYATATDGMKDVAAAAWDEGYEQGRDRGEWEAAPVREEPTYANPYRPTK